MKLRTLLTLGLLSCIGANAQNKLYVDPSAAGNNNGSSWVNAYTSLSNALLSADSTSTIDTVLIAEGIYKPEHIRFDTDTSARSKAFWITRGNIALIGGYAPGGNNFNPTLYKSVISGNIGAANDSTDNSYKLLYIAPQNNNDTIKIKNIYIANLEFREAHANSSGYITISNYSFIKTEGGAIHVYKSHYQLNNCKLSNNITNGIGAIGGGIYSSTSKSTFVNCIFDNNMGLYTGGALNCIDNLELNIKKS